jgi:putative transposase
VKANQASHAVAAMCRVLEISTSGYYAWSKRRQSKRRKDDEVLSKKVKTIYWWSRGTYGAPRIHEELKAEGRAVGRKRIARLMRENQLVAISRRKWTRTTKNDRSARPVADLVERKFTATGPNQLWVADITYIPTTRQSFLYLAVVIDVWSRKVVGWSMQDHLRTELVTAALQMAIEQRKPQQGVIHHSDHGCQYTSIEFGSRCRKAGVRPSMGSVGDCYDNALCESFFATLKSELIDRYHFRILAEAKAAVFTFIESWYNQKRRHSSIGYLSPNDYEHRHHKHSRNSLTVH